jgi:hypothetical protein
MLTEAATETRKTIRQYCTMESLRPLTLNTEPYKKAQEENVTRFALMRHGDNPLPGVDGHSFTLEDRHGYSREFNATEITLLSVLGHFGLHLSSAKDLVRIYVDEYQSELDVIAHVIAYFDISSKRLIDDIPKIFESVFARKFGLELKESLTTKLDLVGDGSLELCSRYIRDEDNVQIQRADLTRQQEILIKAVDTVSRFFKM